MNAFAKQADELFDRIPRRHTTDNVKEMYSLLADYETILQSIEADAAYEKHVAPFFDDIEPINSLVKKSSDNKASKKNKDILFDEASGAFKDSIKSLKELLLS